MSSRVTRAALIMFLGVLVAALPAAAGTQDPPQSRSLLAAAASSPGKDDQVRKDAAQSIFTEKEQHFDLDSFKKGESLRMGGTRLDKPLVSVSELMAAQGTPHRSVLKRGGKKRIAISILASALMPGLGELYVYFETKDRSILPWFPLFMGTDAFLWYGFKSNDSKGYDYRHEYEAYCDEHWSEERFLQYQPWCAAAPRYGCDSWQEYNEGGSEFQQYFFIYMPKSQDPEEYYENCGKYDAFAFGWDDWDPLAWDGNDYEQYKELAWTPHRTYYWNLRMESDKYFARSDRYAMLLIVNRVVSMIDAGWLAYRANKSTDIETGWRLELKPGIEYPTIGVSYRF